jgi:hypothetical protein
MTFDLNCCSQATRWTTKEGLRDAAVATAMKKVVFDAV